MFGMPAKHILHSIVVGVENYNYLFHSGHQESSQSFTLFDPSTCSSLLIRRGHSTWFGAQIFTHLWYSSSIHLVIPLHMTIWFNYTYGIGIQLNIDCIFNGDRVSYSVYCLFQSFMLFTLGVFRYGNSFKPSTVIKDSLGIYSCSTSAALI